jgi:hypothetical protein
LEYCRIHALTHIYHNRIVVTQFIGAPLYFVNREWFYAFMATTKQSFALTITVMTHIWGPATIRISGDESVAGQILPTSGGGVEFKFPERMVMIANHQVRFCSLVYHKSRSLGNRH